MRATVSTMQDTLRQSQVVYLVSSPYSGSTWLSFVLGSHPRAATLGEHWRRWRRRSPRPRRPSLRHARP